MKNRPTYWLLLLSFVLFQGCSVKKFIPEEELLYTGGTVEIDTTSATKELKEIEESLQQALRPEPNSSFLGMRLGLYFYYKSQQEKPGFINRFLGKKLGQEPVYASEVNLTNMEEILLNRAENNGFFYSTISSELLKGPEKKKAKAAYKIQLSQAYQLEKLHLDIADSLEIQAAVQATLSETLLKPGMRFDLATMKAERERIDTELKKKGYYNFQPNALIFQADTNQYAGRKFALYLSLKENLPKEALIPYVVETINVYPYYSVDSETKAVDTVRYDGLNFIQEGVYFKPNRLAPYILLKEGERYNPETSKSTGRRLSAIGSYKFVNIDYQIKDSIAATDSIGSLVATISLSPLKKRGIRLEVQGITKSNGFTGPGLAVSYTNRNVFKGGEIWKTSTDFLYAFQISGKDRSGLTSTELGLKSDLVFPRLLFPIAIDSDLFRYSIPKTKVGVGFNYLNRSQLYSLGSIFTTFGYVWEANGFVTHEFNPVVLNYTKLSNTTPEFEQILAENSYLQNSFKQEFIAGLTYRFTYSEFSTNRPHQFFVNANLDTAGNLMSLVGEEQSDGKKSLLGQQYAQYAKVDLDFRYHFNFGAGQTIAARLFGGLGRPYGNSDVMPYSKQYFSGGPYSVRAFAIRSLGPGSYSPETEGGTATYFDRTGNIRLEANLEYRFPIISFFEGAVFADAGNVWNTEAIENLPGGKLESDFIEELGIGTGVGLRLDIQNFILRFDLAFPLRDPSLPEGERWIYDFGSPVFNFAIGYPF